MSIQTSAQQSKSLKSIIAITDTTADGREFYVDLVYVEALDKWMMRTDQVGIKIIREIHTKNKKLQTLSDSLQSIRENQKIIIDACETQKVSLKKDVADVKTQLRKKQEMLDLEVEKLEIEQAITKDLKKKEVAGKVMTIVGGVGIGVGIAGILYGILK